MIVDRFSFVCASLRRGFWPLSTRKAPPNLTVGFELCNLKNAIIARRVASSFLCPNLRKPRIFSSSFLSRGSRSPSHRQSAIDAYKRSLLQQRAPSFCSSQRRRQDLESAVYTPHFIATIVAGIFERDTQRVALVALDRRRRRATRRRLVQRH